MRLRDRWLRLAETQSVPLAELRRAKALPYIPAGWREERRARWEAQMAARATSGATPYAWTLTEDPEGARRAHLRLLEGVEGGDVDGQPLGTRLRTTRLARGLSVTQVAAVFDVTKGAISQWETSGRVPARRVQRVAEWLRGEAVPTPEALAALPPGEAGRPEELSA